MIFLISKSACILVELRSLVGDSLQMTSLAAICADFRETAAWLVRDSTQTFPAEDVHGLHLLSFSLFCRL